MLQFTLPKTHSAERAEFLRQRVVDLQGGDVAMFELAERDLYFAGRITGDSDLELDLSPLLGLLASERARAEERQEAELRALDATTARMIARRHRHRISHPD